MRALANDKIDKKASAKCEQSWWICALAGQRQQTHREPLGSMHSGNGCGGHESATLRNMLHDMEPGPRGKGHEEAESRRHTGTTLPKKEKHRKNWCRE